MHSPAHPDLTPMHADFWRRKWETNDIAFHERDANPWLIRFLPQLSLAAGSRVFLPLCGKTRDIAWLLSAGYRVAGAELSELAVRQLFTDLHITPVITPQGSRLQFSAPGIDIHVGDIFELTADALGPVDAVYDRAALVALPEPMRRDYARHLQAMTCQAPQLLICFEYDQRLLAGPPFSVSAAEIRQHYAANFALKPLASHGVPGGLKGKCDATENVWQLTPSRRQLS